MRPERIGFALVVAKDRRTSTAVCGAGKMRGIHQAGNQLGLTMAHTVVWLGVSGLVQSGPYATSLTIVIVAVYILDLAHSLSSPDRIVCPSANCSRYGLSITLAYVILFTFIAQLLGFALIIYEVQSAPRRVLADRSLSTILKKSVPQLVAIREETRRVRDMGDDRPDNASPRLIGASFAETTGALRRAEGTMSDVNLPGLAGFSPKEEEKRGRRRVRTASASILLTGAPFRPQQITLDEARPIVVLAGSEAIDEVDDAVELRSLRRSVRIRDDRNPAMPTQAASKDTAEIELADPFDDDVRLDRYSFFRNPRDAPAPPRSASPAGRKSLLSGRMFSPAQAESAVFPYDPSVLPSARPALRTHASTGSAFAGPFSPESKYSRWSADVTTPRVTRKVSVDTGVSRRGGEGDAGLDSPKDEHVLTPT